MKLPCDIVQDLLPLYEDDLCSAATREAIEEHLGECESCGKQHTAVQELVEPEVEVKPEQEKKATVKSFKKIRNRWIASIVAILLLIPLGYLGWGQFWGNGPSFTNLHELYLGYRFVHCLEVGDYEKAFQYIYLGDKKADWLERCFTEEKMENFEQDAEAKFLELAQAVEQGGKIQDIQYCGIYDGGGTWGGDTFYRMHFTLKYGEKRYEMRLDVEDSGVSSFGFGVSFVDDPLEQFSMWSEYLWQDYSGCYYDPELREYVYYDEVH